MDIKTAWAIVGGLSEPSKMPCYGFSIPAQACRSGQKLRRVPNSICSKCYALRGRYTFGVVRRALERRLANLAHPQWIEAMALLINSLEASGFFRWFDSGDLQSVGHLGNIVRVCDLTPRIQHWLPTREYGIVAQFLRDSKFPANLTVRMSAHLVEQDGPLCARMWGLPTSGVSKLNFTCPSSKQGGKCLLCRLCWDKSVAHVVYKSH